MLSSLQRLSRHGSKHANLALAQMPAAPLGAAYSWLQAVLGSNGLHTLEDTCTLGQSRGCGRLTNTHRLPATDLDYFSRHGPIGDALYVRRSSARSSGSALQTPNSCLTQHTATQYSLTALQQQQQLTARHCFSGQRNTRVPDSTNTQCGVSSTLCQGTHSLQPAKVRWQALHTLHGGSTGFARVTIAPTTTQTQHLGALIQWNLTRQVHTTHETKSESKASCLQVAWLCYV